LNASPPKAGTAIAPCFGRSLRARRIWDVPAAADLLVLVLRVLPEKIREWLNAERKLPEKGKEGSNVSDSAREDRGSS
jgi:hypothetical protein